MNFSIIVFIWCSILVVSQIVSQIEATPWSTHYVEIGPYPGTTSFRKFFGALQVFTSTEYLIIRGQLVGLEANVQGGAHVHEGYSCATTDDPGGHWYGGSYDIWNDITYSSDADGNAWFEAAISTESLGKNPTTASNHAFVLHSSDGTRVGCGVIELLPMLTAEMGTYPGYTGAYQNITGFVAVGEKTGGILFSPLLAGLPQSAVGGVHIHEGFTCEDGTAVGGHLLNSTEQDPWAGWGQPQYHSNSSGVSANDDVVGGYSFRNYDFSTIMGRAVVVHAPDNTRIGCGTLGNSEQLLSLTMYENSNPYAVTTTPTPAPTTGLGSDTNTFPLNNLVVPISSYPGASNYGITGALQVIASSEYLIIRGQLGGLEPNVQGGAHVHEGYSCATTSDPGGHWYGGSDDIWTDIKYTSDADGNAWFEAAISSATLGKDPTMVSNHAFVIHSSGGARVGCGVILPEPYLISNIEAYPGYTGDYSGISGLVGVSQFTYNDQSWLALQADVAGLPKSTTGGLHIHTGYTCEDASAVGGHLLKDDGTDPWNSVDTIYESNAAGFANNTFNTEGFVIFELGEIPFILGRAIVLHAPDGTRIGCGIIGSNEQLTYQANYENSNPYAVATPAPTPATQSLNTQSTDLSSVSAGQAVGISIGFSLLIALLVAGGIGVYIFYGLKRRIDTIQEGQVTYELPDISKVVV